MYVRLLASFFATLHFMWTLRDSEFHADMRD
jgi:Zn-dependent protease with chaperone function